MPKETCNWNLRVADSVLVIRGDGAENLRYSYIARAGLELYIYSMKSSGLIKI